MTRIRSNLAICAALWASLGGSTVTAQTCEHAPLITGMATSILENRIQLNPFAQARFGDRAAFMLMTYSDQNPDDVLRFVRAQDGRLPRLFEDLELAHQISNDPTPADNWNPNDRDDLARFAGMLLSARRALLIADEGITYLNMYSAALAHPDFADQMRFFDGFGSQVAFAVADQPLPLRLRLAKRAELAGHVWITAAILGDLPDGRAAFEEFMVRQQDNADFMELDPAFMLSSSTVGGLFGSTPLQASPAMGADVTVSRQQQSTIVQAMLINRSTDYLGILVNQTGAQEDLSRAAHDYIEAKYAGAFDPDRDPEAAAVALYGAIVTHMDADRAQQSLASFNWPSSSIRWYAGFAHETLDVMVAKDAFGAVARGETDDVPQPPTTFAGTQDWDAWAGIAQIISGGDMPSPDPATAVISIELLWEAGRFTDAAAFANQSLELDEALAFQRDALARLHLMCGGHMTIPGGGLRAGGMDVYTFD